MTSIKDFAVEVFNAGAPITTYTVADAATDLNNYRADGWELPEGITAENLTDAMNAVIADYDRINATDTDDDDDDEPTQYGVWTGEYDNDAVEWFTDHDAAFDAWHTLADELGEGETAHMMRFDADGEPDGADHSINVEDGEQYEYCDGARAWA